MDLKKVLLRLYSISRKYIHNFEHTLIFIFFILFSCIDNSIDPASLPRIEPPTPPAIDTFPVISPDGQYLLYNHSPAIAPTAEEYEQSLELIGIWIANANGDNPHLFLKESSSFVDWSPDNKWIVYRSRDQIFKAPFLNGITDATKIEQLTFEGNNHNPDWDPLGQRIVYETRHGGLFTRRIRIMNSDGSEISELNIPGVLSPRTPSWSPDGSRLVFSGYVKNDDGRLEEGLYILNLQSNSVTRLTIDIFFI